MGTGKQKFAPSFWFNLWADSNIYIDDKLSYFAGIVSCLYNSDCQIFEGIADFMVSMNYFPATITLRIT